MSDEVLIKVEGLGKKFCKDLKKSLKYGMQDVARSLVGKSSKNELRKGEFWALKDINFELRRGECLGLLGHNGAGKSTLLKVLNGLIKPDEGKVTIRGRVGALIELGAGFNPILTGRENIYNNASVLGFSKEETDAKLEEIIDFSEIREFIDTPVQNYSSGMKVRLGFAVAAQMEPDVLFIDEVLAVGDAAFRAKCFNRMAALRQNCAVIFVSHSMPLVGRICQRALIMKKGTVLEDAEINQAIFKFINEFEVTQKAIVGDVELDSFKLEIDKEEVNYLEDLNVTMSFKMPDKIEKYFIHYTIVDQELKAIYQSFSLQKDLVIKNDGRYTKVGFRIKNIDLTNGKYFLNVGFIENDFNGKNLTRYDSVANFVVTGCKYNSFAAIVKDTEWEVLK